MKKVYQKKGEFVIRRIVDEILLVPVCSDLANAQSVCVLNKVAEHIWNELDGARTANEVCASVVRRFDVRREVAETDVEEFVAELVDACLIEEVA